MLMIPIGTPVIPWVYAKHIYANSIFRMMDAKLKPDDMLEEILCVYAKHDWYFHESHLIKTVPLAKIYVKFVATVPASSSLPSWAYSYHDGFRVNSDVIQFIKEPIK